MSQSQPSPPGAVDYALLLGLGIMWGFAFPFIKVAVSSIPAVPLTFMRVALTAAMLLALMWWRGLRLPPRGRVWRYIALSALIGNALPFVLIAWGQEKVDGSLASILLAPSPLVAAVVVHFVSADDKLNRHKLAGIGLGIAGIVVLMGLGSLTRLGADTGHQLLILAAAFCYGINIVANRGMTSGSAIGNIAAVMLVSTLLLTPFALLPGTWAFTPSRASILAMLMLVVFSTCIGTLMLLEMVRRQGVAFTAQVNFLVPVFGVLSATAFLGERPEARAFAGLALILAGVAIARRGSGLIRPTAR